MLMDSVQHRDYSFLVLRGVLKWHLALDPECVGSRAVFLGVIDLDQALKETS